MTPPSTSDLHTADTLVDPPLVDLHPDLDIGDSLASVMEAAAELEQDSDFEGGTKDGASNGEQQRLGSGQGGKGGDVGRGRWPGWLGWWGLGCSGEGKGQCGRRGKGSDLGGWGDWGVAGRGWVVGGSGARCNADKAVDGEGKKTDGF